MVTYAVERTDAPERRAAPLSGVELRTSEDGKTLTFRGLAAVYDSEAHGEVIDRTAFHKTVADGADVRFLINHDGVPLARTKSGTLTLNPDHEQGLEVEATLDRANPRVQELESAMRRGDLDQMSFSMGGIKDAFVEGVRHIKEVRLFDVSAVTFPWYEDTTAELRSKAAHELLERYAETLGITIPDWPELRVEDTEASQAENEPDEPSTRETEPEHSLPLAIAARRLRLAKAKAGISTHKENE